MAFRQMQIWYLMFFFCPILINLEALRPKTGNDPEIQQFVLKAPEANIFLDKLEDMIRFLIPNYIREARTSLSLPSDAPAANTGRSH